MDKIIRGIKVDIDIDFWDAVEFGKMMNKTTFSKTSSQIDEQEKVIASKIKAYNNLIKNMPRPLYNFEGDVKYVVIGNILKGKWIARQGLHIQLGDTILSFRGNIWGVKKGEIKAKQKPLENYKEEVGYKEFMIWKESLEKKNMNIYPMLFQEVYNICKGNIEDVENELDRIMDNGKIGEKIELKENEIVDIRDNSKYKMNFYYDGQKEIEKKVSCIDLTQGGKITEQKDVIDIYKYEVQKQKMMETREFNAYGKPQREDDLFTDIYATALKQKDFNVKGIMKDDDEIYFELGNNVYLSNGIRNEMIIKNGILYGVNNEDIIIESVEVREDLLKKTRYIYNDGKIRLVNIVYER